MSRNDTIKRKYGRHFIGESYALDKLIEFAGLYDGCVPIFCRTPMAYNYQGENRFRTVYWLVDFYPEWGMASDVYGPWMYRKAMDKVPHKKALQGRDYMRWDELPAKFVDVVKGEVTLYRKARQQNKYALRILQRRFRTADLDKWR